MAEIMELVEKTSGQMEELGVKSGGAREALDRLTQDLEELSGDLEAGWESVAARLESLLSKVGGAEEALRGKAESLSETLVRLQEQGSGVQAEVAAADKGAHGLWEGLGERAASMEATLKQGFEVVEQRFDGAMGKFHDAGGQLVERRDVFQAFVTGEMMAGLEEVEGSSREGIENAAMFVGGRFLPAVETAGEGLAVTLTATSDEVEASFAEMAGEAATGARLAVSALSETAGQTIQQISAAVDETKALMDRMADLFDGSAQSISRVVDVMSEATQTTAVGMNAVTETLDSLQELFRSVGN